MAIKIKGKKLKDIPTTIQKNSFIKDFNSSEMTFLSLMNDKSKEETLDKVVVNNYYHKCNNSVKCRVLVVADKETMKKWKIKI